MGWWHSLNLVCIQEDWESKGKVGGGGNRTCSELTGKS